MKMKLNSLGVLLLLFHTPFLLAKKSGGGGFGKGFSVKKSPPTNRGNTNTNTAKKHNQGSTSHGGYPKQYGQNNQGGYPSGPGQRGYPQQGGGGYYNHYPGGGSTYGRGYGGYGGQGGHGGYGGHPGYGGYPGGYINYNPNNKILSPQYAGSFGYGGYGTRGGSPFSQSVHSMGYYPSPKSKGFGRTAVVAAAGGAVAGMAVGYGLGRFPRPHFQFHNPREEYYYNHYMYRKYGTKSSDTNDYSRDYAYSPPPQTYDSYMHSCMKRTDLLPATKKPNHKPVADSIPSAATTKPDTVASAADSDISNSTTTNSSAAENPSTSGLSTSRPSTRPKTSPVPPASLTSNSAEDDDDAVSIVEIGYPALIEQLKVRRCVELYMVYSERFLQKQTGGAQGLTMSFQGLLAVVFSTVLMLINSNVLMSLH